TIHLPLPLFLMTSPNRQRRGRYATNACTNCRKRHVKCSQGSQGTACTNCASRNLMCTYTIPNKRGPKVSSGSTNGFENSFGEAESIERGYEFDLIPNYRDYIEETQSVQGGLFPNQIQFNTIMPNNGMPINISDAYSLPSNFSSSFPSIASNLDHPFM
ncbi:5609_t:CDS:1, partial [Racocetra persica]